MASTKQNLLIVVLILFTGSLVEAASYQKKDGVVVDPILDTGDSPHPYSGPNLEPNVWLDCCVDLSGANLSGANLNDTWMEGTDLSGANLSGANLTFAFLPQAKLTGADLTDANLTDAFLWETGLGGADLTSANLSGAFMGYADLVHANLSGADLTGANLGKGEDRTCETCPSANLSYANLTGADLTDANLTESLLDNAIFSTDTILHDGQTVSQWAFDEFGLQTYLEGARNASGASNLTIVPEPSCLLLMVLALGCLLVAGARNCLN